MRIVGGKWRGRSIEAPEGRGITRPTTDRTREQIASMILSARGLDLTGDSVLERAKIRFQKQYRCDLRTRHSGECET